MADRQVIQIPFGYLYGSERQLDAPPS